MAELIPIKKLDFFVLATYNVKSLAIVDASTYSYDPPQVSDPYMSITPPGFNSVDVPFTVNSYNVFNSVSLGISEEGDLQELPDGIYKFVYSVVPYDEYFVEHTSMRVDKIQEKFDNAFMSLDMMECDRAIKAQAKVELNSIYFYIQGSIAAANNCALVQSQKLYAQADKMLDRFINGDCGCAGK